jgi:hypothetical protein
VAAQAAGHTGDVAVALAPTQAVHVAHLLTAHPRPVLGTLLGSALAGGVGGSGAALLRATLLVHVIHRVRHDASAVSGRVLISGAPGLRVVT